MNFSSVAWVPDDDPQRDWETAASLAADWVNEKSAQSGASAVLVTNALNHLNVPSLENFERRHSRISRLASRTRVGSGEGPVLSYVPEAEDLLFAMGLARNADLAVVEGGLFPLQGWAAWYEAYDLVRDEPTPPLPDPIREAVDRLKFYGNNGFGDPFGKQEARVTLGRLQGEGVLDMPLILGAALAAGLRARAIKNLEGLADKL